MRSFYLFMCCFVGMVWFVGSKNDREVRIENESGGLIEVHWVNPNTQETVLMTSKHVPDGGSFLLKSFAGHWFQIREIPSPKTGVCGSHDQTCRLSSFEVKEDNDQVVRIRPGIRIKSSAYTVTNAEKFTEDMVAECQRGVRQILDRPTGSSLEAIEYLSSCAEKGIALELAKSNKEISFQTRVRTEMAQLLENYTCVDDLAVESPDISNHAWDYGDGVHRTVHVKHNRPASKIHVIDNFISDDECNAMEVAAMPGLHRAVVGDGKGGSRLSEKRKAMQAAIKVPWDREAAGHPIARIGRRIYRYTDSVLGLGIKENGQENLMSIQYFGRGRNDTEPDRYMPHCDGDCTGMPHKPGTRVATMVMYCTLPSEGGATNFRNSGIHVKPVKGNAVFFSYIDPATKVMDAGFTEHSGCPVFAGTKKIVTQWIRYGVDDANPWDSFNSLGIKLGDADMEFSYKNIPEYPLGEPIRITR